MVFRTYKQNTTTRNAKGTETQPDFLHLCTSSYVVFGPRWLKISIFGEFKDKE